MNAFDRARKIADTVLYEGYVLYPYRASARKNRLRWQFGVLAPREWSEAGGPEEWASQTEMLLEAENGVWMAGKLRFLHVRRRSIEGAVDESGREFRPVDSLEVDGALYLSWEEGVEREVDFSAPVARMDWDERYVPFSFPAETTTEPIVGASGGVAGRIVREQLPIEGRIRFRAEPEQAPVSLWRLAVRIENTTPWPEAEAPREHALRGFLVGVHTLLRVDAGGFLSLTDPPEWAREPASQCRNERTWPVLVGEPGERSTVLCSPIILEDHPRIAPESPADMYDGTEIDEILTLRTMALTEDEKREARATDERAAALIDRVDSMPKEVLDRLHGAVRHLREVTAGAAEPGLVAPDSRTGRAGDESLAPWWDPGADESVSPETDSIEIDGIPVSRGCRVTLRPSRANRRTDAQDMFLEGRVGRVQAVLFDVDGQSYVAVTVEDDPAAELQESHGRYLYFGPEEVEPIPSAKGVPEETS